MNSIKHDFKEQRSDFIGLHFLLLTRILTGSQIVPYLIGVAFIPCCLKANEPLGRHSLIQREENNLKPRTL